ncbi:MAG: type II toxin-antitoxin system CcdA family antitoxin [Geminicoccaceae bacterium]
MRKPLFDARARKKTVSLTINADLWDKAKAEGLNLSEISEAAIASAFVTGMQTRIQAEIELDLAAYNAFVAEHGSFADAVREHYATREADETV